MPPTSFEPAGGVYCRYSLAPDGAGLPLPRPAYIGLLGEQLVLFVEPRLGVPVLPPVQPSLDAAD